MTTPVIIACSFAGLLLIFLGAVFIKPLKSILGLLLSSALGWAGLYIFNKIFALISFSIGINIASASITGILGLPGLILLCITKIIYGF